MPVWESIAFENKRIFLSRCLVKNSLKKHLIFGNIFVENVLRRAMGKANCYLLQNNAAARKVWEATGGPQCQRKMSATYMEPVSKQTILHKYFSLPTANHLDQVIVI